MDWKWIGNECIYIWHVKKGVKIYILVLAKHSLFKTDNYLKYENKQEFVFNTVLKLHIVVFRFLLSLANHLN